MAGFLKDIAGTKRLMIGRPGIDPLDPATSPNDILFDSEAAASLPVHTSGIYNLTGNRTLASGYVATWPSLGFNPVGSFIMGKTVSGVDTYYTIATSNGSAVFLAFFFPDGLKLVSTGMNYPLLVQYTCYNMPVSP